MGSLRTRGPFFRARKRSQLLRLPIDIPGPVRFMPTYRAYLLFFFFHLLAEAEAFAAGKYDRIYQ